MRSPLLHCPIRGALSARTRATDGLTDTEEKRRIDCIKYLLAKGYPAANFKIETTLLRFGSQGRNSFRTDIAVTDVPVSELPDDVEEFKQHIVLVAEIKRDNEKARTAKATQLYPALDFLPNLAALGVYWDSVEQRLFYRTFDGATRRTHETTIAVLPRWGESLDRPVLCNADLQPTTDLRAAFERIEDLLHSSGMDKSDRFEVMLQLLIAKLYDEHTNASPDDDMVLQDFVDSPLNDSEVTRQVNDLLARGVSYYGHYLPRAVGKRLNVGTETLRHVSAILAPIRILGSRRDVMQDFYMYFARGVYKWDLGQYFTPSDVVDFIVELSNPRVGDQVKDPACGSADFLISALHHVRGTQGDISDAIWGADNSKTAVQVSVLNMVLNGDGRGNITEEDSLANVERDIDGFSVMLCNPPFGVRILERRFGVLRDFDLGHQWDVTQRPYRVLDAVRESQQAGILFAELCVRQAETGGRIGIILPNGYLGNRSEPYVALREWLLRHTRLVAVIGFPRFTFKKSGADVSASVVLLEKRQVPLRDARDSEDYPFFADILESVGWSVRYKKAERIFRRDPESGELLLDRDNHPIPDADFARVLAELQASQVPTVFPWLPTAALPTPGADGWDLPIRSILDTPDLCMDAKRWCRRAVSTRREIAGLRHFRLGDVIDVIAEEGPPQDARGIYQYVTIESVSEGVPSPTPTRGWELPDRGRHRAQQGDIFVGKVWGSVSKWFIAGGDCSALVVTNGFHRLRMRPDKASFLPDVLAGINTEAYRIQARSFATGSDGLADLAEEDLKEILLPELASEEARREVSELAERLIAGGATLAERVEQLMASGRMHSLTTVTPRSSHVVQV